VYHTPELALAHLGLEVRLDPPPLIRLLPLLPDEKYDEEEDDP
jgi:hypothetical protein